MKEAPVDNATEGSSREIILLDCDPSERAIMLEVVRVRQVYSTGGG